MKTGFNRRTKCDGRKRFGRKGQIAGQIFIYAIAVVVVGLIIVYGYSAIKGFRDKGEEVEYITLKTNIENSIKSIASDYGSIKRPSFHVPSKYSMVCFVDKSKADTSAPGASDICSSHDKDKLWPIACEGWKAGRNNVFLIPDGSDAFDVGDIAIVSEDGTQPLSDVCIPNLNGKLNLQLKGLGNQVEVSMYEED